MTVQGATWISLAGEHWEMGHFGSTENRGQNLIKPQGKLSSCNISICLQG